MNRSTPGSVAVALLLVVVGLANPAPNQRTSPQIDSQADATHPRVMAEAERNLATAGLPTEGLYAASAGTLGPLPKAASTTLPPLQREVFGFAFGNASIGDRTYGYPAWSFDLLSTIAYFGLTIDWDGTIETNGSGWTSWNSSALTAMVAAAHAHHVRVILSVNLHNWTYADGKSTICAALHPTHRAVTVAAITAQVKRMGIDGVNLDYEGNNAVCYYQVGTTQYGPNIQYEVTQLAIEFRAALPKPYYIAVDTYSGSAADTKGFFDVRTMAPYVDSFFVMAYDMEYSNWAHAPLNCTKFCLGPTSPLTTYYYNDTNVMNQYVTAVGASKTILGVPYYGRKECVAGTTPAAAPANAYPVSGTVSSDGYLDASTENGYTYNSDYHARRDVHDIGGYERRDTFHAADAKCTRQLYFDDVSSLARKYSLVNRLNLRGAGIFALQYGGGAPELWDALGNAFTKPYAFASADAAPTSMAYPITAGAYYGGVIAKFDVRSYDLTARKGWFTEVTGSPASSAGPTSWTASPIVYGFPGHHYQYEIRAWSYNGLASAWSDPIDVTVDAAATNSLQQKGLYILRGDGYLKPVTSPPVATTLYWTGTNLARAAHPLPGPTSPANGAVLNAHGVLVSYGGHFTVRTSATWPSLDIARDFAFLPDGTGGYVLDGHGRIWPFAVNSNPMPPPAHGNPVWPTLDIARKIVVFADGTGGYVMDYTGVPNPFAIGANAVPAHPQLTRHWSNNFARDMVLIPGTRSGYVMNAYGGLYPFTAPGETTPTVPASSLFWYGQDLARGFFLLPGSTAAEPGGYLIDCGGAIRPWGSATGPALSRSWSCPRARGVTGG